jgi:hypothetical protein
MPLYGQIMDYYPSLTPADFDIDTGTILLQNDSDGLGDYIKVWAHPTLAHPPFGYDPHVPQEETK